MYRFIRTATARTAAELLLGIKFAGGIAAHLNKRHGLAMKWSVESYGGPPLHRHFDAQSLDKMQQCPPACRTRWWSCGAGLLAALSIAGCAVEVQNTQAAREREKASRPPGSVYAGWRVFEGKCAGCHGSAATGAPNAPDLLPIVREMGPRRFMGLVLTRYDWSLPAQESNTGEASIDRYVRREQGVLRMPAWQGEPEVTAHIVDLYAYLTARAEGTQGTGRPPR